MEWKSNSSNGALENIALGDLCSKIGIKYPDYDAFNEDSTISSIHFIQTPLNVADRYRLESPLSHISERNISLDEGDSFHDDMPVKKSNYDHFVEENKEKDFKGDASRSIKSEFCSAIDFTVSDLDKMDPTSRRVLLMQQQQIVMLQKQFKIFQQKTNFKFNSISSCASQISRTSSPVPIHSEELNARVQQSFCDDDLLNTNRNDDRKCVENRNAADCRCDDEVCFTDEECASIKSGNESTMNSYLSYFKPLAGGRAPNINFEANNMICTKNLSGKCFEMDNARESISQMTSDFSSNMQWKSLNNSKDLDCLDKQDHFYDDPHNIKQFLNSTKSKSSHGKTRSFRSKVRSALSVGHHSTDSEKYFSRTEKCNMLGPSKKPTRSASTSDETSKESMENGLMCSNSFTLKKSLDNISFSKSQPSFRGRSRPSDGRDHASAICWTCQENLTLTTERTPECLHHQQIKNKVPIQRIEYSADDFIKTEDDERVANIVKKYLKNIV